LTKFVELSINENESEGGTQWTLELVGGVAVNVSSKAVLHDKNKTEQSTDNVRADKNHNQNQRPSESHLETNAGSLAACAMSNDVLENDWRDPMVCSLSPQSLAEQPPERAHPCPAPT
jgi:hypothetical protein